MLLAEGGYLACNSCTYVLSPLHGQLAGRGGVIWGKYRAYVFPRGFIICRFVGVYLLWHGGYYYSCLLGYVPDPRGSALNVSRHKEILIPNLSHMFLFLPVPRYVLDTFNVTAKADHAGSALIWLPGSSKDPDSGINLDPDPK